MTQIKRKFRDSILEDGKKIKEEKAKLEEGREYEEERKD